MNMQANRYTQEQHPRPYLGQLPAPVAGSSFIQALRKAAQAFGTGTLAGALNKKRNTLNNELNPNMAAHKLGFDDAVTMTHLMQDHTVIKLWAQSEGLVVFEPPKKALVDDKELISCICDVNKETGEMFNSVHAALEDFEVKAHEVAMTEKEAMDVIQAIYQLLHRLREIQE